MKVQSLFKEMGGTYTEVNGYLIPNLVLSDITECEIGRCGRMHLKYIKEHKRVLYTNLLTYDKLNSYLHNIDEQAQDMLELLIKQMTKEQGVTEQQKLTDQMAWLGVINNIRNTADEIVLTTLIYN